jgi:hypothetical protein
MVYLTTLQITETVLRRSLVSVNSEVERVCREVVIAGAVRVMYLFSQAEESHKLPVDFPA